MLQDCRLAVEEVEIALDLLSDWQAEAGNHQYLVPVPGYSLSKTVDIGLFVIAFAILSLPPPPPPPPTEMMMFDQAPVDVAAVVMPDCWRTLL